MGRPAGRALRRRARRILTGAVLVAALAITGLAPGPASADASPDALYLVTLSEPGTAGHHGVLPRALREAQLLDHQDAVLGTVGSPVPVYRWTTALNGFAVRLTRGQAGALASDPRVALVERNAVRRLAGGVSGSPVPAGSGRGRGGAGVVIGVVDSGIWPESPLFSAVPRLGRAPRAFGGECVDGQDFDSGACNGKLVGARWFVDGFGADNLRSSSSLSPRDDDGHGTQMASIAAGDAGVSVRVGSQRLGNYGGVAPQARLAVYKACWTAPDPVDDGCATADLVTAIDRAVKDGVDVLNLSVGGPAGYDTVERALLGATEGGVVVVAAAGNGGEGSPAAHASPWVTTVGATTGAVPRGRVRLGSSGPVLTGAMASTRGTRPARIVVGARVPGPEATRAQARICTPGSLDAARVAGRLVLCERGGIGRVDKSLAVRQADGAGMVLVNVRRGSVDADFHSVPTVHLDHADALVLRHWLRGHPSATASLRPLGLERRSPRVSAWSSGGDPSNGLVKPDVVAAGTGVLGAVPPTLHGARWDFVSGTSAAAAYTSGAAALLLQRHRWSPDVVRSALATTADRVVARNLLREGAGRVRPARAVRPGVAYEVRPGDYRRWLEGDLSSRALNTPSLVVSRDATVAHRRITNIGSRAMYFSSTVTGFARHAVIVTPAAVRLAPGETARFTVHVADHSVVGPLDDGWVTWRGANGTRARIPVLITR